MGTAYKLWLENLKKKKEHLKIPHVDNVNINMDVKEIEYEGVHWIELIQNMRVCIGLN